MSESNALTANLLLEMPLRYPAITCWRNNTGGAVPVAAAKKAIGFITRKQYKDAINALARVIKFGIDGQADISGFVEIPGPLAVRLEVEVKAGKDTQSEEQKTFERVLIRAGGIYIVARDVETALSDIGVAIEEAQIRCLQRS